MSLSNNLETYSDVEKWLNLAVANDGAKFVLTSGPAATRWRQRAYHYRKLVRDANSQTGRVELMNKSPWDGFVIRAEGNIISIVREEDPVLSAMTLDGVPLEAPELTATELLDIATGPSAPVSLVETVGDGLTWEQRRDKANKMLKDIGG